MPSRALDNLSADTAAVSQLLQLAVGVELFTIPLYMTALYSIKGLYQDPTTGQSLWPGLSPNPSVSTPNQLAYNAIFSVYIQEMLHLQLISNLCTAAGVAPAFTPPDYTQFGSTIPCVGDLKNVKGYENVQVKLGPLDQNQIKLFMAIEMPDWEAVADGHPQPAVPFANNAQGNPVIPATFGSIGQLYGCIRAYFDLEYTDGKTLWDKIYTPNSVQVDMFNFNFNGGSGAQEYPGFPVTFAQNLDAADARQVAATMIAAITDQGEGASGNPQVLSQYVPSDPNIATDNSQNDADVQVFWDRASHFARFSQVASWIGKVETWPQWIAARGGLNPWRPDDLLAAPALASRADWAAASLRANAMNDPSTAGEVDEALSSSYCNLLAAMAKQWTASATSFPAPAMQALSTRVATIWAVGGVPSFTPVTATSLTGTAHACQGLDPNNPGLNSCANAVIHTCGGANSCQYQGGCGYPDASGDNLPGLNSAAGNGGCGAPIPAAQIFNQPGGPVVVGPNKVSVTGATGQPVYDTAWAIFTARFPTQTAGVSPPAPNNLRLVLPPS